MDYDTRQVRLLCASTSLPRQPLLCVEQLRSEGAPSGGAPVHEERTVGLAVQRRLAAVRLGAFVQQNIARVRQVHFQHFGLRLRSYSHELQRPVLPQIWGAYEDNSR